MYADFRLRCRNSASRVSAPLSADVVDGKRHARQQRRAAKSRRRGQGALATQTVARINGVDDRRGASRAADVGLLQDPSDRRVELCRPRRRLRREDEAIALHAGADAGADRDVALECGPCAEKAGRRADGGAVDSGGPTSRSDVHADAARAKNDASARVERLNEVPAIIGCSERGRRRISSATGGFVQYGQHTLPEPQGVTWNGGRRVGETSVEGDRCRVRRRLRDDSDPSTARPRPRWRQDLCRRTTAAKFPASTCRSAPARRRGRESSVRARSGGARRARSSRRTAWART